MTYVPAEVARNIRIVTGNNIRHKCGSGPESGDFGPPLQCRSVSDPHVAMLLRMTGRSQKGDVGI